MVLLGEAHAAHGVFYLLVAERVEDDTHELQRFGGKVEASQRALVSSLIGDVCDYFLYIGGFTPRKNLPRLLGAFSQICGQCACASGLSGLAVAAVATMFIG